MCIIRVTYCVHTDSGICLGKSFCCSSCLARGALVRNWWSQCRCYSRWSIYHTWCCWRSQSMCMMLLLFKAYDCFVLWSCFLFSFRVEFPLFCACWLVAVCYVSNLKYHNYSMLFSYRHVWKPFWSLIQGRCGGCNMCGGWRCNFGWSMLSSLCDWWSYTGELQLYSPIHSYLS